MEKMLGKLKKKIETFWGFVAIYVLIAFPTYILPVYGSNSLISYMMSGVNFYFWLHLFVLLVLIFLAKIRGEIVGKNYLSVFAQLALVFDLVPFLNFIPLAATSMHILVILNAMKKSEKLKGSTESILLK